MMVKTYWEIEFDIDNNSDLKFKINQIRDLITSEYPVIIKVNKEEKNLGKTFYNYEREADEIDDYLIKGDNEE